MITSGGLSPKKPCKVEGISSSFCRAKTLVYKVLTFKLTTTASKATVQSRNYSTKNELFYTNSIKMVLCVQTMNSILRKRDFSFIGSK